MKCLAASILILSLVFLSFGLNNQFDKTIEEEIERVEQSLLPANRIVGTPVAFYDLLERMKHYQVPGLSVAVIKDGGLHWAKSYGLSNVDKGTEVDVHTLFQAASISKAISALGVLKLVEEGTLELDKAANDYLKDWQIAENEFTQRKVSVRGLLTHTAGLNVHGFGGYTNTNNLPSTIEILKGKGNNDKVEVVTIPRTEWHYSGGGYVILQKIVEDVTGLPFDEFMMKEVLTPLGMTNSTYQQPIDTEKYKNISAAHDDFGKVVKGDWHHYPEMSPAGLWTTPSDLAKYCLVIQQIIVGKYTSFLSKETIDQMLTKHLNDWGLGPWLPGEGEQLRFSHSGSNEGFKTDFWAFAHKGAGVVFMCNGDNGGDLGEEFMRSVSHCYGWNTHFQRIIEPLVLSEDQVQKYVGTYSWVESKNYRAVVVLKEGKLIFETPDDDEEAPLDLTPISEGDFIDVKADKEIKFHINKESTVDGLTWDDRWDFVKEK